MKVNNQNGYTLVEMMLVLFVVSIISSITLVSFQGVINEKRLQLFLNMFERDVLYAQTYAMSHSKSIYLVISTESNFYTIQESGLGKVLLRRDFSEKIKIEHITMTPPITFFANGSIRQAGKLYVTYSGKKYAIVFLLGKGRFYVKEL